MCLSKTSCDIKVVGTNKTHKSQDAFLSNVYNKQQFIQLLSNHLQSLGHKVINSTDDADTEIAAAAIDQAVISPVTVISDDTDVLLLLVHHFQKNMVDICHSSEKAGKTWGIRDIVQKIGPVLKQHLLFLHAWLGCDTTSAVFDQGKTSLCKKIQASVLLQELANLVSDECSSENDVINAGHKIFSLMYGGSIDTSLTKLR